MGYKTLFEQIKTVCAWNSLNLTRLNRFSFRLTQKLANMSWNYGQFDRIQIEIIVGNPEQLKISNSTAFTEHYQY